MYTLQLKQMMNSTVILKAFSIYEGDKCLPNLDGSRLLGSIEIKWDIGFKWDGLLWNTFASFRQRFVIYFSVFARWNTRPLQELFTGINSVTYFLSFHSLSDDSELVTFLSIAVGVSLFYLLFGCTMANFVYCQRCSLTNLIFIPAFLIPILTRRSPEVS